MRPCTASCRLSDRADRTRDRRRDRTRDRTSNVSASISPAQTHAERGSRGCGCPCGQLGHRSLPRGSLPSFPVHPNRFEANFPEPTAQRRRPPENPRSRVGIAASSSFGTPLLSVSRRPPSTERLRPRPFSCSPGAGDRPRAGVRDALPEIPWTTSTGGSRFGHCPRNAHLELRRNSCSVLLVRFASWFHQSTSEIECNEKVSKNSK